jgi:hypothetical protein
MLMDPNIISWCNGGDMHVFSKCEQNKIPGLTHIWDSRVVALNLRLIFNLIIFNCNTLSNRVGHKLFQLILNPFLTCTIHILYNDSKTYPAYMQY